MTSFANSHNRFISRLLTQLGPRHNFHRRVSEGKVLFEDRQTRKPSLLDRSTRHLISNGRLEPLDIVPFHGNGAAPVSRRILVGAGVHETVGKHIVCHEIRNVPSERRSYCEPHVHDCDEINILLSDSHLSYEIRLENDVFVVNAPATIHIPAGLVHSANVIEGSGFYIAIVETDNYKGSVSGGNGGSERR